MVLSLILFGALVYIYCKLKQNKGEATINNSKGMCDDAHMIQLYLLFSYSELNSGVASRKQEPFLICKSTTSEHTLFQESVFTSVIS